MLGVEYMLNPRRKISLRLHGREDVPCFTINAALEHCATGYSIGLPNNNSESSDVAGTIDGNRVRDVKPKCVKGQVRETWTST